jgi:hypothetical protein
VIVGGFTVAFARNADSADFSFHAVDLGQAQGVRSFVVDGRFPKGQEVVLGVIVDSASTPASQELHTAASDGSLRASLGLPAGGAHYQVTANWITDDKVEHSVSKGFDGGAGPFGGPYGIHDGEKKKGEFDAFLAVQWDSSKAEHLTRELFESSIEKNRAIWPTDALERYNYVVQGDQVLVAVWTGSQTFNKICAGATVTGSSPSLAVEPHTMVDFFSEEPGLPFSAANVPSARKICTTGPKPTGVLDGHGKHFMLAQGEDTQIGGYKPGDGGKWAETNVAYAGEILVDLTNCTYIINQNSGTYQPEPGPNFTNLLGVAKLFKERVGVAPVAVWAANLEFPVSTTPTNLGGEPLDCGT